MTTPAYIAFGSNLGDRTQNIQDAFYHLAQGKGFVLVQVSPIYETDAVGFREPVPPFLNGVAQFQVPGSAEELLQVLLTIENDLGRNRSSCEGFESRIIDLDLLLFGDAIIDQPHLCVPHPRMLERGFVLHPLADIAPHLQIPGRGITVKEALQRIGGSTARVEPTGIQVWSHP